MEPFLQRRAAALPVDDLLGLCKRPFVFAASEARVDIATAAVGCAASANAGGALKLKTLELQVQDPVLSWTPNSRTKIALLGVDALYGGPAASTIAEHRHREVQLAVHFDDSRRATHVKLNASEQPHIGSWEDGESVIVMHFSPELLTEAAEDLFAQPAFEVRPFARGNDPLFEALALNVLHEFEAADTPNALYVESLAHAMAAHVLRGHAETCAARRSRAGLTRRELAALVRFVDERLETGLRAGDLANALKLGAQRFAASLAASTGLSPWRFVQERRLSAARRLLRRPNLSLAQIAQLSGFSSQSHFSNAFRERFGAAPGSYRRSASRWPGS